MSVPNADAEIAARLRLSATRLHRRLRREAGDALSPSQMSALSAIDFRGAMTLGALADHEGVSAPSITKVITILEEKGLVQRSADPVDRRVTNVSTTAVGAALDVLDSLTQKDLVSQ
jgi:DNA-binding MarR family transcriptional regulator